MIKPEDISDSLVERTYQPSGDVRKDIADFLNAAIEAGLVSPPVVSTEDPRILRLALENCADEMGWDSTCSQGIIDSWIKEATEELESEARE